MNTQCAAPLKNEVLGSGGGGWRYRCSKRAAPDSIFCRHHDWLATLIRSIEWKESTSS